jgi:serine/threonine-protein kinase
MNKLNNLDAGFALGRYELVLRIASGGMGEVWAARLKGTRGFQKVVALKFLLPELSANPSFEQMFLDEAALAARIRHPNVVQVVDLGEENEILYQVMEWVNGESLWAVMRAAAKKGGVPLEVAARIICQVCAGLHAAHELKDDEGHSIGLVHRDVTPQNILLTPEGLAKVVDFGVAKFAGRGVAQTQAGELKGKVPYMAPEHIKGRELDRRADVFSLGILFYRVPTISEELSNVVAATLEKSPENRTKTTLDLMHDIERTVPGASMASTNDLVAAFLREVLGDQVGAREVELREALRSLDMRTSLPPEGGRLSQVPAAPAIAPASTAPPSAPASPASAASLTSPPSEGAVPSGLAGPVVSDEADARDAEPHPSWLRRHARAVVAAAAVGLVTVIILVSSGGPQPSPGAGEPVASPEPTPSAAPEPSSSAAPEPTPSADPSAKTAEPSSTSANNASTAPAAGAGTAPGTTGAAPRPTLTPPAGTGGPAKLGPKKREYTPGGL